MADQFIGQILADKYRVEEILRGSEMGNTYRGTHLTIDKQVAIKILSPALAIDQSIVDDFAREAKLFSRISHPHITNVTDYGTDKSGAVFMVSEYLEGETLRDLMNRISQFPLDRTVKIIAQIASALSAAHAQGVFHANLKPENIMFVHTPDESDWVKVLDFDNRKDLDEVQKISPEYLSPEQCSESSEIDARSDVYSLGVILFEMLSGAVPFSGHSQTDVMLKHVQEPPPPISLQRPNLPNEIEQILQRTLAKNPIQRYQSATDLSDSLTRATTFPTLREEETVVRPKVDELNSVNAGAGNFVERPMPPEGNIWKTAFIVLCGTFVLGAGFIYMTYMRKTDVSSVPTDSNSMAAMPISPPTGAQESDLSSAMNANFANANNGLGNYNPNQGPMVVIPGSSGLKSGGGGYGGGGVYSVPPSQLPGNYNIPTGDGNSPFMEPLDANGNPTKEKIYVANINGVITRVPAPVIKGGNTNINANVSVTKNANTKAVNANTKPTAANANVSPATTDSNTAAPTKPVKPGKTPKAPKVAPPTGEPVTKPTPAPMPKETDKAPPTSTKPAPSGKVQDSF